MNVKAIIFLIGVCLYSNLGWTSCIGDCDNGEGTYTWPDGSQYIGQWEGGAMNGRGTHIWASGSKYVGQFKGDIMYGRGTVTWPSGNKYTGQVKGQKLDGEGTFSWPDGRKYIGQFKDGQIVLGQGVEYLPDGRNLFFYGSKVRLRSALGKVLRNNVPSEELKAIRSEAVKYKRRAEDKLVREQQEKDRQLTQERQRIRKQISGIQLQLIEHRYLIGTADGIAGVKTVNAIREFYTDSNLKRPDYDEYLTIIQDLGLALLRPNGDCPSDSTVARGFSVCMTFNEY
tara:strand:+ start:796 stop:1650 length:855 start_codon:yes stop_codon:yes gene_type:complete